MGDEDDRAPRLRDLGEVRTPVTGVPDLGKVGDVGDLPYAVDPGVTTSTRDLRPVLLAIIALVAVVAIVVAFVL